MMYGRIRQMHRYAVQAFCHNHNLAEISAKDLELKTGLPYRQGGRILGDLEWELEISADGSYIRKRNGTDKIFNRSTVRAGKAMLNKFEAHYQEFLRIEK